MKFKISIGLTLLFINQVTTAAVLADYIFEDNLNGNIVGAPDIEYLGGNPTFELGLIQGLQVKALEIDLDTGLKLDISNWDLCDEYTLVIHGYIDDVIGYKKLIDFRSVSGDPGIYSHNGVLEYVNGQSAPNADIVVGTYFQLVITRDIDDLVNAYIDGELQFSFTDNNLITSMCNSDNLYLFLDDLATNTENPQGAIARVTVYDHTLTADEVGELEILDIIFATDFEMIELP